MSKISTFPAAAALGGTEQMASVQTGADVAITPAQIATYIGTLAQANRLALPYTQATHGFVAGNWVYLAGTTWTKTTSAAAASASGAVFVESVPTVSTFVGVLAGPADITGLGYSAGTRRYLTTTAGTTATTPTAGATNFSSPVMVVASATVGYVIPGVALSQALVDLTANVTGVLPILNGGTQAATAYGGFDNLSAHGADVASATTTNLSTSTGYLVDVTGTTPITAITLNEGQFRVVRFTGALTLTNGSSLLLPGGANITTVAGDMAIFVGYAGSVVRCVSYSPITVTGTGSAVRATSPTLVTPALGTPTALILTSATGLPASSLVAGILAASITFGENTALILDAVLSADGKYCGIVEAGTAGAALAFGDLVYLAVADSRWELTDADADTTAGPVKVGMVVLAAAADGDPTTILLWGKIRADAKFPTLTVGAPAYISTTTGAIQVAQPSGTDDVIRVVGYGNTGDELFFCPSPNWLTHT